MSNQDLAAAPPKDLLKRISLLAQTQLLLEAKGKDLAEQMTENNKELEKIKGGFQAEGELPQAMQEAELAQITLENGAIVSVEETLQPPSMAKDSAQRGPMLQWLEANDQGAVIKNSIIVLFSKGDTKVPAVEAFLQAQGVPYDNFATVHPSTLKALLKELLEAGEEVPMDDLGIKTFRQTKVK